MLKHAQPRWVVIENVRNMLVVLTVVIAGMRGVLVY
jgi:hypothetical protein